MTRQLFQYHPTFGYHFVPGLRARVEHEGGGYLVRANAQGFRCDRDFAPAKSADRFRILLFGDSFTAGDGVSNKHRYGDVLEKLVPGLEVYNFGLPGTGTDQHHLVYRELAREIEHDLVLVAVQVENIRRVTVRYRPFETPAGERHYLAKPYYTLGEPGELKLHHVPVPRDPVPLDEVEGGLAQVDTGGRLEWLRRLVHRLGPDAVEKAQRLLRYQPLPGYRSPDHPDWRLLEAILRAWAADEAPGPVLVCPIPVHQYVEGTASSRACWQRFQELETLPNVRVHDLLPSYAKYSRAERRAFRFGLDPHPTREGHRVIAESLAGRLAPIVEKNLEHAA